MSAGKVSHGAARRRAAHEGIYGRYLISALCHRSRACSRLNAKVFGGEPWTLVFQNGPANFAALVGQREISCSFSALLSLWATARAAVLIGVEAMAATRAGHAERNAQPGTPVNEALGLIGAAKILFVITRRSGLLGSPIHRQSRQKSHRTGT